MRNLLFIFSVMSVLILTGCGSGSNSSKSPTTGNTNEGSGNEIKVTQNAVNTDVKKEKSKENSGEFYYAYNKEGESKESKEIDNYAQKTSSTKTTIDAYLHIRSPYERVRITMMIKRLSKDYIIKCSPCHDDYANGVIGPSLLDKNETFIYGMIQDFKTGRKKNPLMKELVEQIDDVKLKQLAGEIANFNKEIRKMRSGK